MPSRVEQPTPTVRQVVGKDPEGRWLQSVLVKQTYAIGPTGACRLAEEQTPLREKAEIDDNQAGLMIHDFELHPFKRTTDVIVKGRAQGYGRGPRETRAVIQVGALRKEILVLGDRTCGKNATGKLVFAQPGPIDSIPLDFAHAYGGTDAVAQAFLAAQFDDKLKELEPEIRAAALAVASRYPRNPCGRGYIHKATAQALETLRLPNLEDPEARLTADNLEIEHGVYWPRLPLPQATDWVSYTWFPRCAGTGLIPAYDGARVTFAEVSRGFLPEAAVKLHKPADGDAFLLTSGAPAGLQAPYLRGGDAFSLTNIHPKAPTFTFQLPGPAPRIWTDGRNGKLNETESVLNSVVVEPELGRLTLIWRGSAPALRPYTAEELSKMPLRVEV